MPEEITLGTLLDSYAKVLRTHADMDFSKSCDRDWKDLQTLLVERPEVGERTISYLVNALQDAAEKRMTSRAEHNAKSPMKDASVIKSIDYDGKVGIHYVVLDECLPMVKDFIRGLDRFEDVKAVWHREHGWLPSTLNKLKELKAFDDARNEGTAARRRLSEQLAAFHAFTDLKPATCATLPEGFEVDDWMFDVTDPEEPKVKRIEIKIDGVTRTVYSTDRNIEELERSLVDLQTAQRAYLGGCVSEMVS